MILSELDRAVFGKRLRALGWVMAVVLGPSCAVLNTMGMSPECKDRYDRCLDGCPNPPPNLSGDPAGAADTTTPSCVQACNDNMKDCK